MATTLLAGMDGSMVVGLPDRAIIAVMSYNFAHVGAVVRRRASDVPENGLCVPKVWLDVKKGPATRQVEVRLMVALEAKRKARQIKSRALRWRKPW